LPLLVAGYRLDFGFQGLASGLEAFQRRVQMEFRTGVGVAATVPVFPDPAPLPVYSLGCVAPPVAAAAAGTFSPAPATRFRVEGLGFRV